MSNVTLAIDDDVLKKVRKLAVERNTTMTALVRTSLEQLAAREEVQRGEVIAELRELFDNGMVNIGDKRWTREELHAR